MEAFPESRTVRKQSNFNRQTVRMKKSRFTETLVISIPKEYDGDMKAENVCSRFAAMASSTASWAG